MIRGAAEHEQEGPQGRPQVIEISSATAMLGPAGMALLAVSDGDGEVAYGSENDGDSGLVLDMRGERRRDIHRRDLCFGNWSGFPEKHYDLALAVPIVKGQW
jgi:hypothetical protein